jgi:large subunit ribosomal protein L6
MSRIGKLPITLPTNVTLNIDGNNMVSVKGPLGELSQRISPDIKINVDGTTISVTRPSDRKDHRSLHGLYRALINNMIIGVSKGYTIKQELVGVGYRAECKGQQLILGMGYSHDIIIEMPKEIKVEAVTEKRSNPVITLTSFDKQLLGHVAAKIRSIRPPEPYKGKGIRFVGEEIRKKAGKSASAQ